MVLWWLPGGMLMLGFAVVGYRLRQEVGNIKWLSPQAIKRIPMAIGIVLVVGAGLARWWAVASWEIRIPEDWDFSAEYLGYQAFANESGHFPKQRDVNLYKRHKAITEWHPDRVAIKETYTTHDAKTGAVTWQSIQEFELDPKSGKHLSDGHLYLLPRDAKKERYKVQDYLGTPYTLQFEEESEVEGLKVYKYSFKGDLDFTTAYAGTKNYPGIVPPDGQRIVGFNYHTQLWVEPNTGNVIKISEAADGDYIVDESTRNKIKPVMVWNSEITGSSIDTMAQKTKHQLKVMRLQQWWLPGVLLTFGALLFGHGYRNRHGVDDEIRTG